MSEDQTGKKPPAVPEGTQVPPITPSQLPPRRRVVPPPPPVQASGGLSGWIIVLIVLGAMVPVLGIMAGFLLPALAKAQEAARRASCMNNVRQIGLGMIQYAGDHDDAFMDLVGDAGTEIPTAGIVPTLPSRSGFAVLLNHGYLTTTKVFICPSSTDRMPMNFPGDFTHSSLKELILPETNCSYGWDPTKKHTADATCAIIADKPPRDVSDANAGTDRNNSDNHDKDGQCVFYNDGHVKWGTTPQPDAGDDPDVYTGGPGYETSQTDAKIIR